MNTITMWVLFVAFTPNYDGVKTDNLHPNGRFLTEAACEDAAVKVTRTHQLSYREVKYQCLEKPESSPAAIAHLR